MKGDVGAATLDNVLGACDRLAFLESLDLPWERLTGVDQAWIALPCRRVEGENASEMRRHGEERRLGLQSLHLMDRHRRLTDDLVDLLLEIIHRLQTRSRRTVVTGIARDIERVHGKERLLFDIAEAAIEDPEGRVVDVIHPVAGAARLKAVIDEHRARGTLDECIQTVMRGSCAGHCRRMMPKLLSVLRFRSNNAAWHPILGTLELIVRLREEGRRTAPADIVPAGSVPAGWRDFVIVAGLALVILDPDADGAAANIMPFAQGPERPSVPQTSTTSPFFPVPCFPLHGTERKSDPWTLVARTT